MAELMEASRQWASRPDDERYTSLDELHAAVERRRGECWTSAIPASRLRALPMPGNGIALEVPDATQAEPRIVEPTNWSFSQLSQYAGAPGGYLRKLPAELAAINLQWGLEHSPTRDEALVLGRTNGDNTLRAMTSTSYGRIWDADVVGAVQRVNDSGRWQVPAASYAASNPKRATTLYASDRDVFIFLVDPSNPIEVAGETIFRGFMTWNSEVGSAVFGLTTFLYRYVCDNRIVWGATDVKELRIRHTGGAPERFAHEGARYLKRYGDESTEVIGNVISAAKRAELPEALEKDGVENWLQKRGFTKSVAKAAVESGRAEEGAVRTVWDVVSGVTAYARSVTHTDTRVGLETAAGKLLNSVA